MARRSLRGAGVEGVVCFGRQQTLRHTSGLRDTDSRGLPQRGNREKELPEQAEETRSTVGGSDNSIYSSGTAQDLKQQLHWIFTTLISILVVLAGES